MLKRKKKHHYLPQFYLAGFTDKNREVFVFNKETGLINKQGKNGTFHLPYFYTVDFDKYEKRPPEEATKIKRIMGLANADESLTKEYPDIVEDLLSESENNAAIIIPKIIDGQNLNNWERIELSTFIAFMYARTPFFRDMSEKLERKIYENKISKIFSSKENIKNIYKEMRQNGYNKEINPEDLFDIVKENRYKISIPREISIKNMLYCTSIIDRILYNKTWFVKEAPINGSFITTDQPVFMANPNKISEIVGFNTPDVLIIFPLSQKAVLIMKDTKYGATIFKEKLDKINVRKINMSIASNAKKYIIAKDEALLQKIIHILK